MAKKDAVGGIGITCDHDRCSTEKPTLEPPSHNYTRHIRCQYTSKKVFDALQTHHERAIFVVSAACTQWRWWSAQRFYRWTINCVNNEPKKKCTVIGISESAGDSSIQWLNWSQCHMCRGRAGVTVWCVSFHNCIGWTLNNDASLPFLLFMVNFIELTISGPTKCPLCYYYSMAKESERWTAVLVLNLISNHGLVYDAGTSYYVLGTFNHTQTIHFPIFFFFPPSVVDGHRTLALLFWIDSVLFFLLSSPYRDRYFLRPN